ncbi:MAG TPA: gephyrin-like molybdotransferase Glp [Kineosporiaceae bacterium]|nr:gephyrin-like molybdotransferase Glp [Kineosporiaceae bacterium]
MIPVEEHLARCLAAVGPLPVEEVPLLRARGRTLARDVASPVALPGFDNSAMDGFAVRAREVAGAADDAPVVLPVAGEAAAGASPPRPLAGGAALRIMTGAPVPEGADAVVPVEWTGGWTEGATVTVRRAPDVGAYVRRAGEDVGLGEIVVRAGTVLTSRQVALLAAVGCAKVPVHRAPRVAVLSSGSELVPPDRPLGAGQVHDSNGYGLAAAAEALAAVADYLGIVPDDEAAVRKALEEAGAAADLVVTSGGVSAGVYDTVKEVLTALGTVRFDRVAMQPGMPQGFGTLGPGGTPVFTLPGNPVSSMVSFEVFVRPAVRALAGVPSPADRPQVVAAAATGWTSPRGRRQFTRAVLDPATGEGDVPVRGLPVVRPVGAQGSHLVADLASATCLAVVPEGVTVVRPGDELQCLLFSEMTS